MKTSWRRNSISPSSWVSSCPARPTNGSPWRSSSAPGASPMNIRSASALPEPKTALVRSACERAAGAGLHLPVEPDQLLPARFGRSAHEPPLESRARWRRALKSAFVLLAQLGVAALLAAGRADAS